MTSASGATEPMRGPTSVGSHPVTMSIAQTKVEHGLRVTLSGRSKVAPYCGSIVATHTHAFVKTDAEIAKGIDVTLARGFAKPGRRTSSTLGNTLAFTIAKPQVVLSGRMALTSCMRIPAHGSHRAFRDTVPEVKARPEVKPSTRVTLLRGPRPPLYGLAPTSRPTSPQGQPITEPKLRVGITRRRLLG